MRLIDADALIEQEQQYEQFDDQFTRQVARHCIDLVEDAPTADAIPIEFIEKELNRWCELGYEDDAESLHILMHNWRMERAERKEE